MNGVSLLQAVVNAKRKLKEEQEASGARKCSRIGRKTWESLRREYQIAHDDQDVNEGALGLHVCLPHCVTL